MGPGDEFPWIQVWGGLCSAAPPVGPPPTFQSLSTGSEPVYVWVDSTQALNQERTLFAKHTNDVRTFPESTTKIGRVCGKFREQENSSKVPRVEEGPEMELRKVQKEAKMRHGAPTNQGLAYPLIFFPEQPTLQNKSLPPP